MKAKRKNKNGSPSGPTLRIAEHLPEGIYADVCKACVEGLMHENWDAFSQYVTEQTIVLDYKEGQAEGGLSVFPSLSLACSINALDDEISYEIRVCKFIAKPCVMIEHSPSRRVEYILFRIIDCKVTHIVRTPQTTEEYVSFNPLEDLPMSLALFDHRFREPVEPLQFHLPCFVCGAPSHELEWRKLDLRNERSIISGAASICPHCNRQAEYYIESQTIIPKKQEDHDLPF